MVQRPNGAEAAIVLFLIGVGAVNSNTSCQRRPAQRFWAGQSVGRRHPSRSRSTNAAIRISVSRIAHMRDASQILLCYWVKAALLLAWPGCQGGRARWRRPIVDYRDLLNNEEAD